MTQTDLIIIGAGPGGYRAAAHAAAAGLQVDIFEQGHVGGTCLNVGCIPTKTFVHSATLQEALQRRQQVVEQLRAGVEHILSQPAIRLHRTRAAFVDAHTVATADGQQFTASRAIIVATGSRPKMLPLSDIGDPRVVDSTGLLQRATLPRRLCIIGAGVIGMEFASVYRRFGAQVTVIEYLKECLPMLDSDIAKRLRKLLEKRGINFRMKTAVQQLADLDADVILMATGRQPNVTDDFRLAGFDCDQRRGITVDDHMQTTVKGIYAIGDVNGRQLLAHAAEMQARVAVSHLLGQPCEADLSIMPAAIFTSPEAACVGCSEDRLRQTATPYECRKAYHRANGKALAMGQTEGMVKLLSAPGAGRILGCHAYGAHSADLVQEAAALMAMGATVRQLRNIVHIHPTLSELLLTAAEG